MIDECCEECSYWEDRVDVNISNEIKMKVKSEETTILAIPKLNRNETNKPVDTDLKSEVDISNLEESDNSVVGTKSPQ
jgi:hypothetical protein